MQFNLDKFVSYGFPHSSVIQHKTNINKQAHRKYYKFHNRKEICWGVLISAIAKEGLQPVPAGSINFASIVEGGTFWVEKY